MSILEHSLLHDRRTANLFKALPRTKRIIDVGCGIRPCPVFSCEEYVCIEPHFEYVNVLKGWRPKADKFDIHQGTAQLLVDQPREGSTVLLLDVIEHMPKDEGLSVLRLLEQFDHAVVFTPFGWHEQEDTTPDAWGYNGGFWQKHRSAWFPEDFEGWSVVAWDKWHSKQKTGAILATR